MYTNLNNILIVFVILLSICSCKAQKESAVREYFISHRNAERPVSDIIESYELIQLEETEGAFFSSARRIIFSDDKTIILSGDSGILIFSESGEFIRSVNKQGRGPDEYMSLSDICLDTESAYLVGSGATKIILFDRGGNIFNKLNPGFRFNNVHLTGEGQFLFDIRLPGDNSDFNYNLVLTDRELNIIDRRLQLPLLEGPGLSLYGQLNRTSAVPGKDYFFSLRCDTVYRIHERSIVPGIVLNYGREVFSITATGEPEWEDTYNMVSYAETGNCSLLVFRYEKNFYTVIMKEGNEAKVYRGAINITNNQGKSFTWSVYPSYFEERINTIDPGHNKCTNPELLEKYLNNPEDISSLLIKVNLGYR